MSCTLLSRSIGGVPIDVFISEQHKGELEIADHPVESSASISDHAWRKPYECQIEGVCGGEAGMASYETLLSVQASVQPFDLVTGLKVYTSMLIQSLEAKRDKETSRVLSFTAMCREVIIVSTSYSSGQNLNSDAAKGDGAKATASRGDVQARAVTPPQSTRSILSTAAGE